jgi:hypothetical protein
MRACWNGEPSRRPLLGDIHPQLMVSTHCTDQLLPTTLQNLFEACESNTSQGPNAQSEANQARAGLYLMQQRTVFGRHNVVSQMPVRTALDQY